MFHFYETLTDTSGNSLVGFFLRLLDSGGNVVSIYSDDNGTPISVVSGHENMAASDEAGNISLFVEPGTYTLNIYGKDATTFFKTITNYPMTSSQGVKGDKGDPGAPGPADNTYPSLAGLKASDISQATARIAQVGAIDGSFTFVYGDFTGLADNFNIIQSDNSPLAEGAWVRQGAESVFANDSASGSIFTNVQGFITKFLSASGSSAFGFLASITRFGPTDTDSHRAATVEAAYDSVGVGGVLTVDQDLSVGANPVENPGTSFIGEKSIYHVPAGGGGRRVDNLVGREAVLLSWGMENLGPVFLTKLQAGSAIKVALIGDSNTEAFSGPLIAGLFGSLANVTVTNYGVSGTTFEQWRTGTGDFAAGHPGAGKDMAAVMAADPDLIIDLYGGTNDPAYGGTIASFEASKRAGYNTIRSTTSAQTLSIVMVTSGPQNDGTVNPGTNDKRDELWNAQVRPVIRKLASDYGCAFVDKNGLTPDAFVDFANNGAPNTNLDINRVHSQPWLSAALAQHVFEAIVPSAFRLAVVNPPSGVRSPAVTDAPTSYPKGISIYRADQDASAWPVNGFVYTVHPADGTFPLQEAWGYNSNARYQRSFVGGVWLDWETIGIPDLSAAGVTSTSALSAYPRGDSSVRAQPSDGWPLDGYVRTWREAGNGLNGWQEIMAYSSDVATQKRTYTSSGWGAWQ